MNVFIFFLLFCYKRFMINCVNFCLFLCKAKEVFSHLRTLILDSDIVDEAFKPPDNTIK